MIKQKLLQNGREFNLEFYDCNNFRNIDKSKVAQVYGVCFYEDKLVLGFNNSGNWSLLGGKPEPGEDYQQTLEREVKEESNMKLLKARPIGYQYVMQEDLYQLRYACKVEPYGEFVIDPSGGITEIKLIDQKEYTKYLKWSSIGDHIIKRSLQIIANV